MSKHDSITAARGHRWPLSRDQAPPRPRRQALFGRLEPEADLRYRDELVTGELRKGVCGEPGECEACGYVVCACAKPAAAEPAREGEREGWTAHAPCGGGWSCCYHFAGAPGIHVFQNNTTLGDAPGSHHYVTKHRFGAGEPQAFGGTRLECQLHVEAKLAAAQPKAQAAVQPKRRLGAFYSCLDCDVENDRACVACTAEADDQERAK